MEKYKAVYIVNAMQRSGNHAIANWIIANLLDDPYIKLEYLEGANKNQKFTNLIRYYHNSPTLKPKRNANTEYSYIGLENKGNFVDKFKNFDYQTDQIYFVTLIRNPINHISSLLNHGSFFKIVYGDYPGNFREYLNVYNMKNIENEFSNVNTVGILYDKWFADANYKNTLSQELNIGNNDFGLNTVPSHGAGSSFDGFTFDGKAQKMDVLNRWKNYYNYDIHYEIISELKDEIEKVFGKIPYNLDDLEIVKFEPPGPIGSRNRTKNRLTRCINSKYRLEQRLENLNNEIEQIKIELGIENDNI